MIDMSPSAVLLTDNGYADTIHLLTPFGTAQITRIFYGDS